MVEFCYVSGVRCPTWDTPSSPISNQSSRRGALTATLRRIEPRIAMLKRIVESNLKMPRLIPDGVAEELTEALELRSRVTKALAEIR